MLCPRGRVRRSGGPYDADAVFAYVERGEFLGQACAITGCNSRSTTGPPAHWGSLETYHCEMYTASDDVQQGVALTADDMAEIEQ